MRRPRRIAALSLLELLTALGIIVVLATFVTSAAKKVYTNSSLAISANNIRALSAASANYLADNNYTFWPYRYSDPAKPGGVSWWFGYETAGSMSKNEGERAFDSTQGPLGGYVPASFRPDPSFKIGGKSFKPKYRSGYLGVGYNILLGGGWMWDGKKPLKRYWELPEPGKIVVFSTSAQVNNFQSPASRSNPMLEEFYALDGNEVSVHFRHAGSAMVAFADGSAGFLPMDPSTRDVRAPEANVGRFAPRGNTKYLLPEVPAP